jgi:hypothetical protein
MSDQNVKTFTEDAEFREAIRRAQTPNDISAATAALMARQSGVQRDPTSGRFVSPQDNTAGDAGGGRTFTQTIDINGTQVTVEGTSPENLAYNVDIAKQAGAALTAGPQKSQEQIEAEAEAEEVRRAAALANLELRFRRGEISVKDYVAESGAVAQYLEEQGIHFDQLREDSQKRALDGEVQSWAQATEQFLNGSGADWPGNPRNQKILENTLAALDLLDTDDRLGALTAAWAKMKADGTYFPYEDPATAGVQVANEKTDPSSIATPAEILDAWKRANGFDPAVGDPSKANAALIEAFRRRG